MASNKLEVVCEISGHETAREFKSLSMKTSGVFPQLSCKLFSNRNELFKYLEDVKVRGANYRSDSSDTFTFQERTPYTSPSSLFGVIFKALHLYVQFVFVIRILTDQKKCRTIAPWDEIRSQDCMNSLPATENMVV